MPTGDSRGVEKFFDGKIFDPADPAAYLKSLVIKRGGGLMAAVTPIPIVENPPMTVTAMRLQLVDTPAGRRAGKRRCRRR